MSKADAIKMVKEFRTGFVSVNESFIAYMPLHSVDKNELGSNLDERGDHRQER